MQFQKLDRAKDKNFCSVRAGSDLRLILHRSAGSLLLCFVGHHDPAYAWAERRKLETHPKTGAAQLANSMKGRPIEGHDHLGKLGPDRGWQV